MKLTDVAKKASRLRHDLFWRSAPVVRDATSAAQFLESAPDGEVRVRVTDVHALRLLTLPGSEPRLARTIRIHVDRWEDPRKGWRGSPLPVAGAQRVEVLTYAKARFAVITVTASSRVAIADVARAALPALIPTQPIAGAGFPRISVHGTAPAGVLAALPTRAARRLVPFPSTLEGVGLKQAEFALVDAATAERAPEAAGIDATNLIGVDASGLVVARTREPRAVIDLHVHNPIGRVVGWRSGRDEVLDCDAGTLHIGSVAIPLDRPLDGTAVRLLRRVDSVDLARLASGGTEFDRQVKSRLAEMAAAGVILHGLEPGVLRDDAFLAPAVVAEMQRPYSPATGLDRDLRSVALRRAAMLEHGGFVQLASAVEQAGHRLLPKVSVILSSMRPDLARAALAMMARQTYPYLEVVLVMHGQPAPDLSDLAGLDYTVISEPSSTLFGSALAAGVRASSGDLVTKLDDDDWYSENHIWDLVLAHLYSGADVVGKTTEYLYFEHLIHTVHRKFATECYHQQLAGGAMMLSRSTLDAIGGWRPTPNSTDRSILIAIDEAGGTGYRAHSLGYLYIRHASTAHTWIRDDSPLIDGAYEQWRGQRLPEVGYPPTDVTRLAAEDATAR